jgi:hypothetical protein
VKELYLAYGGIEYRHNSVDGKQVVERRTVGSQSWQQISEYERQQEPQAFLVDAISFALDIAHSEISGAEEDIERELELREEAA